MDNTLLKDAAWIDHERVPGIQLRRVGNIVEARVAFPSTEGGGFGMNFGDEIYWHPLFEQRKNWRLINLYFNVQPHPPRGSVLYMQYEDLEPPQTLSLTEETKPAEEPMENLEDPEIKHSLARYSKAAAELDKPDDQGAQTIRLMEFTTPDGEFKAEIALGHVGGIEFGRAVRARFPDYDLNSFRYEYAVFRDDESVEFNVRPDTTNAKAVTVAYHGARVAQL